MIRKMWHRRRRMLTFIKKKIEKNTLPNGNADNKHKHKQNTQTTSLKSDPGPGRRIHIPSRGRSL